MDIPKKSNIAIWSHWFAFKPLPTWNGLGQSEEGGVIGNVAAGEQQSPLLLVQVGQGALQVLVHHRVTGNVPSTPGSGAVIVNGISL